jgi:glycosyltransferase involved in cell wall biosynthesis
VLFVGNLVAVKGPDVLLDAWARVPAPPGGRALAIIGAGPWRSRLERQARRLGIADTVTFLGARPHAEVALWMNAADVLCLPSRNEGMPNVVLEALASGLPVAATDVGACREMLQGEPAGAIVAPDDAAGLAAAVGGLLAANGDRAALAARQRGRHSWDRQAAAIGKLVDGMQA